MDDDKLPVLEAGHPSGTPNELSDGNSAPNDSVLPGNQGEAAVRGTQLEVGADRQRKAIAPSTQLRDSSSPPRKKTKLQYESKVRPFSNDDDASVDEDEDEDEAPTTRPRKKWHFKLPPLKPESKTSAGIVKKKVLNKSEALRDATMTQQKATSPSKAKRISNLRVEPAKRNTDCNTLLELSRQAAEKAATLNDKADNKGAEALAGILEIEELVSTDPAAQRDLTAAYKEAGIKISKKTVNKYTPLVKLVLPDKMQNATTISRYANVAWLAEYMQVKPAAFAEFVRENGGLTGCEKLAARTRREIAGRPLPNTTAAQKLKARKKNAPKLRLPREVKLSEKGYYALLVERTHDGSCSILAHHSASPRELSSFMKDAEPVKE